MSSLCSAKDPSIQKSQPYRSRHWPGRPAPLRTRRVPFRRSSGAGVISGRSSLHCSALEWPCPFFDLRIGAELFLEFAHYMVRDQTKKRGPCS